MGLNSSDRKGQKGDTQEMSHNLTGKSNRAPERTTNTHPYEVAVYKNRGANDQSPANTGISTTGGTETGYGTLTVDTITKSVSQVQRQYCPGKFGDTGNRTAWRLPRNRQKREGWAR